MTIAVITLDDLFEASGKIKGVLVAIEREVFMPITVRRSDDIEKLWENLITLPKLEKVEYPNDNNDKQEKEE